MTENRLNIINATADKLETFYQSSQQTKRKELQARFERLWLINPEQFNPLRNCMERERLDRTWQLLIKYSALSQQPVVDIGCAAGVFSRRLRDAGAQVMAVDIAENALKLFRETDAKDISLKQEAMPITHLPDQTYKVVICTEVIADISREDYRLFFAELARLIQADGYLLCSTPIDIDTVNGLEKLQELAQSEFDILEAVASYHSLYIRLKRLLKMPSLFIEAWRNPVCKRKEMTSRKGFGRLWFWVNTTPFLIWFWFIFNKLTHPILKWFNQSHKALLSLEKICRFFWDQEGVSHYLFIASRRPLPSLNPQESPLERPKRKEIWE